MGAIQNDRKSDNGKTAVAENHKTTIKDIAKAAGVSISLVSFVMNNQGKRYRVSEEMTKKIFEVAKELNYQPNNAARSLRSGRSRTIGVIVSDISNKFFADIARCIEDNAYTHNYTVIFGSSDENAQKLDNLLNVFINKGVDGLIIVPCEGSEESIRKVVAANTPVVLLDRHLEGVVDTSYVVLNNRKATAMATEELIANGFKHIEMVSYDMHLSNIRDREDGYSSAMMAAGLDDLIKIHRIKYNNIANQTQENIRQMINSGVEAIIFATNTLTMAGLKTLERCGIRVPDQMAIVGFDGSEAFELFYTTITYIKQPIERFGSEALELVIKNIEQHEGNNMLSAITLAPEIIRGSSSLMTKHQSTENQ